MCKSLDTGFIFLTLKGEKFEGGFFYYYVDLV